MVFRRLGRLSFAKRVAAPADGQPDGFGHCKGYAICTLPRSGSNWLSQVLTGTGELGCPLEYFNTEGRRQLTDPAYPREPHRQLREVLTRGATANAVYGVKIFPPQLTSISGEVKWTEALPNLKLIRWNRRDILGQALSRHRALETRQWRAEQNAGGIARYDGPKILASLLWIARQNARWDVFFARTAPPALTLCYEEALADPQGVVDAFAQMMGLETRPKVDPRAIGVRIQRDDTTTTWRERFQSDYPDLNYIDDL